MYPANTNPFVSGRRLLGRKEYDLTDHLGNVTTQLSDRKTGTLFTNDIQAQVLSYQQYFPFGWNMPGRTVNGYRARFDFQNQETDTEWLGGNAVAYKYRFHDPRLGRFQSYDPMASYYPWNSPYAFSENVVISHVELEGLERGELPSGYEHCTSCPGRRGIRLKRAPKESFKQGMIVERRPWTQQDLINASVAGGEILAGFTAAGWTLDARDVYMAYSDGDGWGMLIAGVGFIPVAGDITKKIAKAVRKGNLKRAQKIASKADHDFGMIYKPDCGCFIGNTLVKTQHGDKKIEEVGIGNWVYAYDELTDTIQLKQVTAVQHYYRDTLYLSLIHI